MADMTFPLDFLYNHCRVSFLKVSHVSVIQPIFYDNLYSPIAMVVYSIKRYTTVLHLTSLMSLTMLKFRRN